MKIKNVWQIAKEKGASSLRLVDESGVVHPMRDVVPSSLSIEGLIEDEWKTLIWWGVASYAGEPLGWVGVYDLDEEEESYLSGFYPSKDKALAALDSMLQ